MRSGSRSCSVAVLIGLGACSRQMEPAERALGDVHAVVAATAADAGRYVPDELVRVQQELDGLDVAFRQHQYAAVLGAAPGVMTDAQRLAAAAAARKSDVTRALEAQWSAQAASLPDSLAALEARVDALGRRARPPALDLAAARIELRSDESLWSKAQAAFATGNLTEAVTTAKNLAAALAALAAKLA